MISGAHKVMMAMISKVAVPLAAVLSSSYEYNSRTGTGVCTSASVTCTASGGSGTGYTYSWSRVSGDTSITIVSASSSSTTFTTTFGAIGLRSAVFKCTVDDSLGNGPVDSGTVTIELERIS